MHQCGTYPELTFSANVLEIKPLVAFSGKSKKVLTNYIDCNVRHFFIQIDGGSSGGEFGEILIEAIDAINRVREQGGNNLTRLKSRSKHLATPLPFLRAQEGQCCELRS